MKNIYGLTLPELTELLAPDLPRFRAVQIAEWLYKKDAGSFAVMTNLPQNLRDQLAEKFSIYKPQLVTEWNSADGETSKFLLSFADGEAVETVLMRHDYGNSICVSTQVGCAMGCAFCASTLRGVSRDLTAGEMLAEVLFINERLKQVGQKVDTLVLMGSGEPLMNYDNVLKFIRLLHEEYTLNLGYRNITLSTSGIVPGIERLTGEGLPINLSISLHAVDDVTRSELMPINKKYAMTEVMQAADNYAEQTKRRITYEYILIDRKNDRTVDAERLAKLLKGKLASVNLIPINPVVERALNRPSSQRVNDFKQLLEERHINVTIRREMGTDIQAACGQLRNKHLQSEDK